MFAILCHNPTAGLARHTRDDLLAALELAGIEAAYCSTKGDKFPYILNDRADLIIAAGGDGTVAKVIKTLPDRDTPIAIVPLGSANNVARTFGIAGAPHELAEGWRLDRWRRFDIGLAHGPWGRQRFIEGVGLGWLAGVMSRKTTEDVKGAAGLMTGRKALRDWLAEAQPMQVCIAIDGQPLQTEELLAAEIVNARYLGPGLPLPGANPSDGMLGVVAIRRHEREAVLSWMEAPHRAPMPITEIKGRRIDFEWEDVRLRLDDQIADHGDGPQAGTVEIDGTAVKLLVPPPKPEPLLAEAR